MTSEPRRGYDKAVLGGVGGGGVAGCAGRSKVGRRRQMSSEDKSRQWEMNDMKQIGKCKIIFVA